MCDVSNATARPCSGSPPCTVHTATTASPTLLCAQISGAGSSSRIPHSGLPSCVNSSEVDFGSSVCFGLLDLVVVVVLYWAT